MILQRGTPVILVTDDKFNGKQGIVKVDRTTREGGFRGKYRYEIWVGDRLGATPFSEKEVILMENQE